MSLISTKNFLAPLNNKVHLVSIILATFAFATLRLSGCAVSTVDSKSRLNEAYRRTSTVQEYNRKPKTYNFEKSRNTKPMNKRPLNKPINKDSGSHALDDIEKIMGMR